MTQTHPSAASTLESARRAAFRPALILVATFLAISAAMLVFLAGASAAGAGFDSAIWIRSSLVLASAIVLLLLAVGAVRGSRSAWVRLRIISPVVLVAVIVIVSIPGFLPDWVRIEQAVCGILMLPVAIFVNLRRTRALFPAKA